MFDRRLLPGDDPQAAFAAIAAAADIGERWQVKTEFGPFMYPSEIAPDGAFMRAVNGGCRRMSQPAPATFSATARSMPASSLQRWRIGDVGAGRHRATAPDDGRACRSPRRCRVLSRHDRGVSVPMSAGESVRFIDYAAH